MLVHFLFTSHSTIDLNQLYFDKHQTSAQNSMYYGLNKKAYIATFFGIAVVGVGVLIPQLSILQELAWLVSMISSSLLYWILTRKEIGKNV